MEAFVTLILKMSLKKEVLKTSFYLCIEIILNRLLQRRLYRRKRLRQRYPQFAI